MSKDPAFLFYPNDYIGGTMGMTFEQKGAYMEILMAQFNRGHMTSHMIGQVLGQTGGQIWDTIKDKFEKDSKGRFYNARLEEEQSKRKRYTESRKNNIEGKNQYTKEPKKVYNDDGHMTSHMENRNRNEIYNSNKIKENFKNDEEIVRLISAVRSDWEVLLKVFIKENQLKGSRSHQSWADHFNHWLLKQPTNGTTKGKLNDDPYHDKEGKHIWK